MARAHLGAAPHASSWITICDGVVTIEIIARPGAARRGIVRFDPRGLIIALDSVPEKGEANHELIRFLAGELKVERSAIAIVRGETAPRKTVRIGARDPAAIATRLDALVGGAA